MKRTNERLPANYSQFIRDTCRVTATQKHTTTRVTSFLNRFNDDDNNDGFDVVIFFHWGTHTFTLTPIFNFIKSVDNICILMKWNEKGRPLHHHNCIYNYVHWIGIYECNYFIFIWINVFKNRNAMHAIDTEIMLVLRKIPLLNKVFYVHRIESIWIRNSLKSQKYLYIYIYVYASLKSFSQNQLEFMEVLVSVDVCYSIRLIFVCTVILTLIRHKFLACSRNMIGMNKSLNIHFCHFRWMCKQCSNKLWEIQCACRSICGEAILYTYVYVYVYMYEPIKLFACDAFFPQSLTNWTIKWFEFK